MGAFTTHCLKLIVQGWDGHGSSEHDGDDGCELELHFEDIRYQVVSAC